MRTRVERTGRLPAALERHGELAVAVVHEPDVVVGDHRIPAERLLVVGSVR